jgi:hypothetical protein
LIVLDLLVPGEKACRDLMRLVATNIAVIAIVLALPGKFEEHLALLKRLAQGGANISEKAEQAFREAVSAGSLEKTFTWIASVDEIHPLACSNLELAPDWLSFCLMVLGIE